MQAVGNAGVTVASLSVGSGQGWSTPTSGNLLVVTANSDATVTGPSGFTAGPSVVDGNGAYMWWKVSAGTESTITVTPSSSANTAMTCAEYSGIAASPLDASNSSTIAGSSGTTTTSTSVTSTAAGDLVVAAALLHGYTGSAPTSPTWTNSFTNVLSPSSGSGVATHVTTFYADLIVAGAAGAYATSASWTNAAADRQEIVMAFLAAAGTTVNGTATIAGAGAVSATVTEGATAAPTGTGALIASVTEQAGASPTGTGVLAATIAQGSGASLAGAGSASATVTQGATGILAATGLLAALVTIGGSATAVAAGSLSAVGGGSAKNATSVPTVNAGNTSAGTVGAGRTSVSSVTGGAATSTSTVSDG